jgi:hypothetical protein
MSTTSYEFGQNGTQQAEQSSGMSGTTFWVYTHTIVSNIKVAAAQKNSEQDSYVTMVLTTSDGITTQETKQITGGRGDCSFNNTLSVNQDTWFNITFWANNSIIYWDSTAVTEFISTGWTGNSLRPSAITPYALKFTITYDPIWTIDEQNDGYLYPIDTDPMPFTEFEKDNDGYPKNFGIWKLDGKNDNYPWITGFKKIVNNLTNYKIYDSELNELKLYDNELNELKLYKK